MVKEGESGDTFFILTSGTCNVYQKNSKRESVLINQMRSGDHFGEKAIKNESNTRATGWPYRSCINSLHRIYMPSPSPQWRLFSQSLIHISATGNVIMRAYIFYGDGLYGNNITFMLYRRYIIGFWVKFWKPWLRTASVQVVSKTAVCLIIQKKDVNRLIGNIEGKLNAKDHRFESWRFNIFYLKTDS